VAGVRPAVLITGARAPVALDIARSFAAAGFAAHLADSVPSLMAQASRSVAGVHRYAPPRQDRDGFRRDVAALVAALDPVIIVPTCEEVFHLAAAAPSLGIEGRLFAPPLTTLRELHAKSAFAKVCAELGLRAPKTWRLDAGPVPPQFIDYAGGLVFKPDFSRFGTRTLVRPQVEALAAVRPSPLEPWAVQEFIAGREVCFYAVCREGVLTAFSAYAPSWRLKDGASYGFEPLLEEGSQAQLHDMAATLATVVRHAQFSCDAIIDAHGQPWLIECNARATSGAHLFGRGPALARAMLGEGTAAPTAEPRYLAPAFWLFGLPAAVASGETARWAADLSAGRDVISAPGDGRPVVGALLDSLRFQASAVLAGRSLAAEMTADIEWNGEDL
jgi:hypothetical protein